MSLYLLDTHVLLWAAGAPRKLSPRTRALLQDAKNALAFSAASMWEIVIKRQLGRADFFVEPRHLRRGLLDAGYRELAVACEHAIAVTELPALHRDPFDRMLIAQAIVEGATLLTADEWILQYEGPIRKV